MNRLHLFNPGHEEALCIPREASYTAPKVVLSMMHDLFMLTTVMADDGDYLLRYSLNGEYLVYDLSGILVEYIHLPRSLDLKVWAPEPHMLDEIKKYFSGKNIEVTLPVIDPDITSLSHRNQSYSCLEYLSRYIPLPSYILPRWFPCGCELQAFHKAIMEAITLSPLRQALIKFPFSSSGRGLVYCDAIPEGRQQRMIMNRWAGKGSLSIEPLLDLSSNWAAEFFISREGMVTFEAYSMFSTSDKGAYQGNVLMPQHELKQKLSVEIGSSETLDEVITLLTQFIHKQYSGHYTGYVGVDMLLYDDKEKIRRLHPCVEINLRNTMGNLAHLIYERICSQGVHGIYHVDYFKSQAEINKFTTQMTQSHPAYYDSEGKLTQGFYPITNHDHRAHNFIAYLIVNSNN
ncbi:hypothetical protein [Porphyromonas pogonae]|uniref:hypothetical protein n=1 Tax=Porphyromonas pogonae TaxID=867595 RepID=UPI002E7A22BB|nr:hypothetical protein [Porphyromonas pogonae]